MRQGASWVAVGRVRKPVGLRGEVAVEILGDTAERFTPGRTVYVQEPGGKRRPLIVSALQAQPRKAVVAFEGIETIEEVEAWRGRLLEVRAEDLPELEPGRFYYFQLLDLLVTDARGRPVGVVREILETGAQPLLVVREGRREHLVPFVAEVVASVDLEEGVLVLSSLEGLLDL